MCENEPAQNILQCVAQSIEDIMPLECPAFTQDYNQAYSKHNICLDCRYKHKDECWYYIKTPVKLSNILTASERLAILEDIKEIQPVFKPRPVDKEIDQLKAGYIHLQNKLNEYIDKKQSKDKL